jgi:ATP-dependent Clp protease ATP-binding subunit ClpA
LEDSPNCVLLLDEVEKAHPDLMSVLLSLLDEGVITSSTGKQVSAKNAIIILTSNLGARDSAIKSIGFNEEKFNSKAVDAAISQFFAPEFRNRLDGIVGFDALRPENMRQIVIKFLKEVESYVSNRHIVIEWSDSLIEMLETKGYDPKMGARPLARLINTEVKLPLAKYLLDGDDIYNISVNYVDGTVVINQKVIDDATIS